LVLSVSLLQRSVLLEIDTNHVDLMAKRRSEASGHL